MKKALLFLLVLALVAGGIFLYMIRPVSAPSSATPPVASPTTEEPLAADSQVYVINPAKSEARFEIDEVLNNAPFHVVGKTNTVAGQITFNASNPALSSVGTISINARTLKTDSEMRNGMIGRMILKSEENEFITFAPKSFSGLPESPVVGQEYNFKATGTLTVAGTSRDVTFDVKAKAASENEIQGTAVSVIDYKDFTITIPKVSRVASVEDKVTLTFSFVAEKK